MAKDDRYIVWGRILVLITLASDRQKPKLLIATQCINMEILCPYPGAPLDLSSKLGKDRHLTSKEHKHHFDLKLCVFCRATGHMAKDCQKSTSCVSKACTAKISPTPEMNLEASTPEAKK
ncbi:hypothetical protein BS17DRAFT_819775 [Gyrodon lividus]|nr:hypothetical protein BS17DRAFT_819775 [Gyrodon lividus]